jgi:acyl-CoA dehydrogenase
MGELGRLLSDTVTRLFNDLVTKELIESAEKGAWPDKLWRALEEGGLTLPLVPEAHGGAGGTWADRTTVVRAAGKHAAPVPLAETIVAGWLLGQAGLDVPMGPLTIAPSTATSGCDSRAPGRRHAARHGHPRAVGRAAGHVVIVAEEDATPVIAPGRRGRRPRHRRTAVSRWSRATRSSSTARRWWPRRPRTSRPTRSCSTAR